MVNRFRPRKHKYGAHRTQSLLTGRSYPSKLEAMCADRIEQMKRDGKILDYLEQVPIQLPGKTRLVLDFMLIEKGGGVKFIEAKGQEPTAWRIKIRQVEELHPHVFERLEIWR